MMIFVCFCQPTGQALHRHLYELCNALWAEQKDDKAKLSKLFQESFYISCKLSVQRVLE